MTHKIGDRVGRLSDVFDRKSKMMYGEIINVYVDPEIDRSLYDVKWDHKTEIEVGFLEHGIRKISYTTPFPYRELDTHD